MDLSPLEYRYLDHDIQTPLKNARSFIGLALMQHADTMTPLVRRHLESAQRSAKALQPVQARIGKMAKRADMDAGVKSGNSDPRGKWGKTLGRFAALIRQMHSDVSMAHQSYVASPVGRNEDLDQFMEFIHDGSREAHQYVSTLGRRQNQRFSLERLIRESMPALEKTGLAISHRLPQEPVMLTADQRELQRILVNLAKNADLRGHASELAIHGQKIGGKLRLRITNNGRPIPEADQAHIFTQGFSTARSSGLGLALSRLAAQRHGGKLRLLESTEGRTTFELELPLGRRARTLNIRKNRKARTNRPRIRNPVSRF